MWILIQNQNLFDRLYISFSFLERFLRIYDIFQNQNRLLSLIYHFQSFFLKFAQFLSLVSIKIIRFFKWVEILIFTV
jgi:hypothetical protein